MDMVAVWDKGNTHRLNIDSKYKEKRRLAEKDPVFKAEVTKLFEEAQTFLSYIGVKSVWVPGEEADDVIALLCQKLEAQRPSTPGTKICWFWSTKIPPLITTESFTRCSIQRTSILSGCRIL